MVLPIYTGAHSYVRMGAANGSFTCRDERRIAHGVVSGRKFHHWRCAYSIVHERHHYHCLVGVC